jgi:hypothetical protein
LTTLALQLNQEEDRGGPNTTVTSCTKPVLLLHVSSSKSKQLFDRSSNSFSGNLSVSQLLIIVSDWRGVFHDEGRVKVMQSVMKA